MTAYQRKDPAYREAKRLGLRSRAALKLRELDERFSLFRPGQKVVELGCWPGGWLQVAAARVGDAGRVAGIDLVEVEPLGADHVRAFCGDVRQPEVLEEARAWLGGAADLVLSDLAPKLTGIRAADRARHEALVDAAVEAARLLLAPGGTLLVKLFSQGEAEMTARLRSMFDRIVRIRPSTTRKGSSELYAIGRGLRGAPVAGMKDPTP